MKEQTKAPDMAETHYYEEQMRKMKSQIALEKAKKVEQEHTGMHTRVVIKGGQKTIIQSKKKENLDMYEEALRKKRTW